MRAIQLVHAVLAASMLLGSAATARVPDAEASDPAKVGWMQGYPPAADKIVRYTDPDYYTFPKLRWTVCHLRELRPTTAVQRGPSTRALERALDAELGRVKFTPTGKKRSMTFDEAFDANYSDGVIVMHRGRVVYERYAGCLGPDVLHDAMSVTESLTGLLAEILVAEGLLNDAALVGDVVPELKQSAVGDATVRQVMDMTTALDYWVNPDRPKGGIWKYGEAGSIMPMPAGYAGPDDYFDYVDTVIKSGVHGAAFGDKYVNAAVLGWIIARAAKRSVAELLADRIWTRLGVDREAYYTVGPLGTPFAAEGFNATLPDLARLGQLMLDEGRLDGEVIVPAQAIASIQKGGDPAVFAKAGYALPGWSYRSMWWNTQDDHGAYAARSIHGQTLWIDPKADMVIARYASHPKAANAASDATSLPAYRAVADYLMAKPPPTVLVGAEWVVEDIAGGGVIDNTRPSLLFAADGRLAGSTSCNRLLATYTQSGDTLQISPVGTTNMACPPAVMNQEQRFTALLPQVRHWTIDATGTLILTTDDGKTLTARRQ